jgi:hypothetical protein
MTLIKTKIIIVTTKLKIQKLMNISKEILELENIRVYVIFQEIIVKKKN